MAMYVGVNGTPKEISSLYVGVNGVPKEVNEVYAGDNGSVKLVENYKAINMQIFTSSTVFTIPSGVREIQCFLVGGGGGSPSDKVMYGGGGGGYTKTEKLNVDPGKEISISVASSASASSVNDISALGGKINSDNYEYGGDGGSGGGYGYGWWYDGSGGAGASDGNSARHLSNANNQLMKGGTGQGTTTRAFGEQDGTIYAGGGGGAGNRGGGAGGEGGGGAGTFNHIYSSGAADGAANTGGGCGGGGGFNGNYDHRVGGSGIVILRWIGKHM